MEKMRMESINLTEQNIEKIGAMFPNVITEAKDENGKFKKAINFALLKQMLADDAIDGDEAYEFTWVGKKSAIIEAGKPIRKTLRPCKEESKDWDNAENLYIEGDNLDVMKLLQESYLGAIKMIYIDPPYNTGNDYIYKDDFSIDREEYDEQIGLLDEDENRLFKNNEANGRFHSDWCSMLYPRLKLAQNLLANDGVIFISIDDNEVRNLKIICDEIFGEGNFVSCIANVNNPKGRSDEKYFATAHEYILVYKKMNATISGFAPEENVLKRYNKTEVDGRKYRHIDLRKTGDSDKRSDRPKMFYYFMYNEKSGDFYPTYDEVTPEGYIKIYPTRDDGSDGRWRVGIETAIERKNVLVPNFMSIKGKWTIVEKDYLTDELKVKATTSWTFKDVNSERGTEQFIALGFDKNIFPRPKPLGTIQRTLSLSTCKEDIILDFFSGSSTTAHAVMQLNAEDGGNRKFIMVQLPEMTDENSEAYKAGYKNICEIGKERIRRAGEKIKEEAGLIAQDLDIGFRVLKLDSTNMKDVYYSADEYSQGMLSGLESNIKEDRTDMDLLFGCLLEWGLPLSLPHVSEEIDGVLVHNINDGDLIACFAQNISEVVVKEIAKRQPLRTVFRDSSFANSPEKINVEEIFKLMAPNTSVKVL